MKIALIGFFGSAALLAASAAHAGEAKVTWQDVDSYTDAKPGSETKGAFHKRLKRQFEEHFNFEAQNNLPEGYTFNAEITDLDLAGDSDLGRTEASGVKRVHFPRIEFTYNVTDAKGTVVSEGDVAVKDMNFLDTIRTPSADRDEFYYDFRLISDWFDTSLYPELAIKPSKKYN